MSEEDIIPTAMELLQRAATLLSQAVGNVPPQRSSEQQPPPQRPPPQRPPPQRPPPQRPPPQLPPPQLPPPQRQSPHRPQLQIQSDHNPLSVQQHGTGSQFSTQGSSSVISRHRTLFSRNTHPTSSRARRVPYGRQSASGNQRQVTRVRRGTFSRQVICLADRNSDLVPSIDEKLVLKRAGLGEKNVKFPKEGTPEEVQNALYDAFPKLKDGGGFEILRNEPNSRTLLMVLNVGPCSAEDIKTFSTKLYIRPIQRNISVESTCATAEVTTEKCQICNVEINVAVLRSHFDDCYKAHTAESDSDSSLPDIQLDTNLTGQSSSDATWDTVRCLSASMETQTRVHDLSELEQLSSDIDQTSSTTTLDTASCSSTSMETQMQDGEQAINEIITAMQNSLDTDASSTACLKVFISMYMKGRKLDPETPDEMEGKTFPIFISRSSVLQDVVGELMVDSFEPNVPLSVEFFGEDAADYGGPRRELLRLGLNEIMSRVFAEDGSEGFMLVENLAYLDSVYKASGILMGLCVLQGGPRTTLLSSSLVESLVADVDITERTPLQQFRDGLRKTGILQLMRAFPQCKALLLKETPEHITVASFLQLFEKEFSESGSNARQREEATMGTFVRYLRQVGDGSRVVKLPEVLKFVTGLCSPPLAGFNPHPKIIFMPSASYLPRAQTCTNTLILPVPLQGNIAPPADLVYEMLDHGFKSDYFGLV